MSNQFTSQNQSQNQSPFAMAFDTTVNRINDLVTGENGSLAESTTANGDVDFNGILCEYFLLMRGSSKEQISLLFARLCNIIDSTTNIEQRNEYLISLLKITLFIRQPRKGKGERRLFYNILEILYSLNGNYRKIFYKCLDLIPQFGYFKDFNNLYVQLPYDDVKKYIIKLYVEQLINDASGNTPSLCAKWAPREHSVYDEMAKDLVKKLIEKINPKNKDFKGQLKEYRKLISTLNKKINTVQTFMCQKHWADIDFKNVPSVSMTNLTKAFQDEKTDKRPKADRVIKIITRRNLRVNRNATKDTRRHHVEDADYEDREKCRLNLYSHIQNGGKINSQVTDLTQIIERYLNYNDSDITWEAQWDTRVLEIQEMVSKLNTKPKIFPMVDLSASMSGSPMLNAITLGLFTSTIMDNPKDQNEFDFANRFMSFSSTPRLVRLPRNGSLKEKVNVMKKWTDSGCWGGSTNIHAAINLLLSIAIDNKVPQNDMPEILAIFSDMQFDQGDSAWNKTSYENISDEFRKNGYKVPHILFWNLRSDAIGYQVKADTPNSSMLSGYSPRMLDLFLTGDLDTIENEFKNYENETDNSETNVTLKDRSTLSLLNRALNHEMFEPYNELFNDLFN